MVSAMAEAGAPFVGALYAGLALSSRGPRVVEFNARFGDPETQALMPRLRSDFCEVALATAAGDLAGVRLEGLDDALAIEGVEIFHAGTIERGDELVTAGGRVLAVSALGDDFASARARAYEAANAITFEGKHQRSDIALRATEALS
jgi:phosphoribosylamine--glycine ligase